MKTGFSHRWIGIGLILWLVGCSAKMQSTDSAQMAATPEPSDSTPTSPPQLASHRSFESDMISEMGGITWSPDGTMLALCGNSEIAGVWDTRTLSPIHMFDEGRSLSCNISFSPDGRWLMMSREMLDTGYNIKLWNVDTWEMVEVRSTEYSNMWNVVWSPDGTTIGYYLVDGSEESLTLEFFAIPDSESNPPEPISIPALQILDAVWLPDGTIIALVLVEGEGVNETLKAIWRSTDPNDLEVIGPKSIGPYGWPILNASASMMAIADGDGNIDLWDVETRSMMHHLWFRDRILSFDLNTDGTLLAVGDQSKVTLWDVETGGLVATLKGHDNWAENLAFSPDGLTLAVIEWHGKVHLWSLPAYLMPPATPTPIPTNTPLPAFASLPEPSIYTLPSDDPSAPTYFGHFQWLDADTLRFQRTTDPDVGSYTYELMEFDTLKGEVIISQLANSVFGVLSPDGSRIAATIDTDSDTFFGDAISIYDASTYQALVTTTHQPCCFGNVIAWSPDSTRIAFGNYDSGMEIYDARTGEVLATLEDGGTPAWSPNRKWIAGNIGRETGTQVIVWDANTYEKVYELTLSEDDPMTGEYGLLENVEWSPDGTRLLLQRSGWADILDVASQQIVQSIAFTEEDEPISMYGRPTWSSDGVYVVNVGDRWTINGIPQVLVAWNTLTGEQSILVDYPAVSRDKENLYRADFAWSPNHPLLVTADWEGTLYIRDVATSSGQNISGLFNGFPAYLGWSPDGSRLAAIKDDGTIFIWNFDR